MTLASEAAALPDIPNLIRISKAIAMLDAILSADWQFRYYSFNSHWSENDSSQMMASMRDGSGDHYFIWFAPIGVAIKGFAHESFMSPYNQGEQFPGILDQMPAEFAPFLEEPAFVIADTTFCFWRKEDDSQWLHGKFEFPTDAGPDPDGSRSLLSILDGKPATYVQYASNYFEIDLAEDAVAQVYNFKPLTPSLLSQLKSERALEELAKDVAEIGYPVAD